MKRRRQSISNDNVNNSSSVHSRPRLSPSLSMETPVPPLNPALIYQHPTVRQAISSSPTHGAENLIVFNEHQCVICFEILLQAVRIVECSHIFCAYCLRQWLNSNPACPVCRQRVRQNPVFDEESNTFIDRELAVHPGSYQQLRQARGRLREQRGVALFSMNVFGPLNPPPDADEESSTDLSTYLSPQLVNYFNSFTATSASSSSSSTTTPLSTESEHVNNTSNNFSSSNSQSSSPERSNDSIFSESTVELENSNEESTASFSPISSTSEAIHSPHLQTETVDSSDSSHSSISSRSSSIDSSESGIHQNQVNTNQPIAREVNEISVDSSDFSGSPTSSASSRSRSPLGIAGTGFRSIYADLDLESIYLTGQSLFSSSSDSFSSLPHELTPPRSQYISGQSRGRGNSQNTNVNSRAGRRGRRGRNGNGNR